WESLLLAGKDLGCAPFGVEAQRILRLEKGHFIVGQDTDGLTKAPTVGLNNLVKLDKDDMVGFRNLPIPLLMINSLFLLLYKLMTRWLFLKKPLRYLMEAATKF
ncbi:MAG TPA: hypothetical protein QF487_06095, partial [Acidimicrobiales bacterium]|nr:hypothetical protein [Acidimicrobiales bacterium]